LHSEIEKDEDEGEIEEELKVAAIEGGIRLCDDGERERARKGSPKKDVRDLAV
jgi:hypothetical protein